MTGPRDVLLNSTVRGALPESTSTEKEARGGAGVGSGMGVVIAVGGTGVAGGVLAGIEPGFIVGVGASVTPVDEGTSGKALSASVSGESEGIMKSQADRTANINVMNMRNVNGVSFTFKAPCSCPLS